MKTKSQSKTYKIVLEYDNRAKRTVMVKAASLEVAEDRALKRNPNATGIYRGA